jgi:hypothetical protein
VGAILPKILVWGCTHPGIYLTQNHLKVKYYKVHHTLLGIRAILEVLPPKKNTPFILISDHGSQFFSKSQITTQRTASSFMKADGSLRFLEYWIQQLFESGF